MSKHKSSKWYISTRASFQWHFKMDKAELKLPIEFSFDHLKKLKLLKKGISLWRKKTICYIENKMTWNFKINQSYLIFSRLVRIKCIWINTKHVFRTEVVIFCIIIIIRQLSIRLEYFKYFLYGILM